MIKKKDEQKLPQRKLYAWKRAHGKMLHLINDQGYAMKMTKFYLTYGRD